MKEKTKVLIVDGSAVFRQTLTNILQSDPSIEIIATAANPFIAANKMIKQIPDVITIDIDMSRMNGIIFLQKIMSQHPIPVIVISSLTESNTEVSVNALRHGAIDVMGKSIFDTARITEEFRAMLCEKIKSAAKLKLNKRASEVPVSRPKLSADAILQKIGPKNLVKTNDKVIVLGASTGGTEAIKVFLQALQADTPGVVIVQHMPENFTRSFAERLNGLCEIEVKEAEDGDIVLPGRALIAPGKYHILLKKRGLQYYVEVSDGPPVNRHRPSVDVLFRSAALYAGKNGIGIILTGMGDDGAKGLLEMREAGARTIAQDEKSSIVFGMPKEAILLNAAGIVLPLNEISGYVMQKIYTW